MSQQLSLLDPDPRAPFRRTSPSSRDGAKSIDPSADSLEARALSAYRLAGARGLTDEELAEILEVKVTTAIPRRHELINRELLYRKPVGRRLAKSGVRVGYWVTIEHQPRDAADERKVVA